MEKLIITVAPTGNVPTKEMNPNVPIAPEEIADCVAECAAVGASVVHIHARDAEGKPTHARDVYKAILDAIASRGTDVITQLSTGVRGGANTAESRGQMLDLDCDMASLATGSSNFPTSVNANSPDLIKALAKKMYDNNVKPEIEAFDAGMISGAEYLLNSGVLKAPLHFNLVMNVPGSIKGTPRNLMFMVESLPPEVTWSVCGIGKAQLPMLTMGILLGGHARTGLEDTLEYEQDVPATNAMLVERVARIARELGRDVANTDEARAILGLSK